MQKTEKAIAILVFGVFICVIAIQVFFGISSNYQKEKRADRLGATWETQENFNVAVEKEASSGVFVLLTFQTEKGVKSPCSLLVNGEMVGDFRGGLLSIQGHEGDEIALMGDAGVKVHLLEYPENLKEGFSTSLVSLGKETSWGRVSIK